MIFNGHIEDADRYALRRNIGKNLGFDSIGTLAFYKYKPKEVPVKNEELYFGIMCLATLWKDYDSIKTTVPFEVCVRYVKATGKYKSLDTRYSSLLEMNMKNHNNVIRTIYSFICIIRKETNAVPNLSKLYFDLINFNNGTHEVQRKWARAYWYRK